MIMFSTSHRTSPGLRGQALGDFVVADGAMTRSFASRAHQPSPAGESNEITLPDIIARLSRLETDDFSYDELLHDFASRRRVGPVKELPVQHSIDPAEQTDDIVQAYLSQTRGGSSTWLARWTSGGNPPCLHSRRGSNTVAVKRQQPRTGISNFVGASTAWQASEGGLDQPGSDRKRGRAVDILESPAARGRGYSARDAEPPPESSLQYLAREHIGLVGGDGRPGHEWMVSNSRRSGSRGGQPDDAAMAVGEAKRARRRDSHGEVSGFRSSWPRNSVDSPHMHDSFNYYPLRPTSAEAVVSLISPRTSKKIRRLPPPGQLERESLERVEHVARTFSTQALELRKKDGLYFTLGRREVGLIDNDIDDLAATITDQAEVLAVTTRAFVMESLTAHGPVALAKLLGPRKPEPLATVNPPCILGPDCNTRASSPDRPARRLFAKQPRSNANRHPLEHGQGGSEARSLSKDGAEKDLKPSLRVNILEVDAREHRQNVGNNLRRLRALLGQPSKGGSEQPASPSPFSLKELRVLGAAKRQRPGTGVADRIARTLNKSTNVEEQERADDEGPQGAAAELSLGGNTLLRSLATAILSSVQARIQRDFLILGLRKWQTVVAASDLLIYLDAVVLVQRSVRRTLAIVEACERQRLRDQQARRATDAIEAVVRCRQRAALELQRWIRGSIARRRVDEKRCLLQAAQIVQRAIRTKAARVQASKQRAEDARRKEADDITQRKVREAEQAARAIAVKKAEELARKEALLEHRRHDLEQCFRREGATRRIQAVWRARVLQRNLRAYLRIAKRPRAIRIQRAVRGFLARRELRRRKEAFLVRFEVEIAASIKIQTLARRLIGWNKAEARRFNRSKEQLVSTLDAERALRPHKRKLPLLRAVAKREGIMAANAKGEPYIVDTVALKVFMVDKKRAFNPWQESTDRNAAIKIQTLCRGYRQVVRVRLMRVRQRRESAALRRRRKSKAVNDVQRVFRGRRARLEAKSRRYGLRAVRVQKVWRGFLGRRAAADRRQRIQASTVLQRRLRGAQARALAARMRHEATTTSAPAVNIQATARRFLAQRFCRRLVSERQREREWVTMAGGMGCFCAERARLRVIVEGAAAPYCKGDGVTQFIFRKLAVKRSVEEGSGAYRLEGRAFNKLLASTPRLFNSSFHATDVDLIFAKTKGKEEKTITYAQFAAALHAVAAALFPQTKRFKAFEVFNAKNARLLELIEGRLLKAPGATEYRDFCQKAGERYLHRSAVRIQARIRGRIGRKRLELKRAQTRREKRSKLEAAAAVIIQALGRRYRARSRAIRLAKTRISKYIDPATRLPYWVHSGTGVTLWMKPKVFRAEDVDDAMLVATSKTEHLVKCSVCDDRPAKRLCKSCRDSYCDECFQALHGKGNRREHKAPMIPMCCVCKYQHGSRLCETCTFKTSSTCAYCDVCFFNRHPGLDPLINPELGGSKTWTVVTGHDKKGIDHRWTPLVVICVECRRYAARWLCDNCEEVYCVGCYASVHMHGIKVNHGAEKLPYYQVDFHMEYAMACRRRSRKQRDEEAHAAWLRKQERARQRAATKIQARWRGQVGRITGRAFLKAGRAAHRQAWRQRKRDERLRRALWYGALDLAGIAPRLKSDTADEKALKRVPRAARLRARKYIALNREDDAWVPGKLDGRKGIVKRGFAIGDMEELKDQARRGGVRLPGRHWTKTGHRVIYTDPAYDLRDFVKPRNVIRVEGYVFRVEAVKQDRIWLDRVWHKPDTGDQLLYKMVLNPRQMLLLRSSRAFWSSQPTQFGIQAVIFLGENVLNRLLRKAGKRYKRKRQKRLYGLVKSRLARQEEQIRSLKLTLTSAQFGLDRPAENEGRNDYGTGAAGSDANLVGIGLYDEADGRAPWRNTAPGERGLVTSPSEKLEMAQELARQKEELEKKRSKKAGKRR